MPSSGAPVPPSTVNDRTSVPGAATSTHGPRTVNSAGRSSGPTAPTVSTSSPYQPGSDTRSGRSAVHPPLPALPAAATTTTSAAAAAPQGGADRRPRGCGCSRGQAHRAGDVDDRRARVHGLPQCVGQRGQVAGRLPVRTGDGGAELPQREDAGAGCDPDQPVAGVRRGADQTGDRGAVPVAVVEPVAAGEHVAQPAQPARQPRVRRDSRVDHHQALPAPGGQRVRRGQAQPRGQG